MTPDYQQLALDRPASFTVVGEQLLDAVARSQAGAFTIHQMKVGATPSEWVLSCSWPQQPVAELPLEALPY